MLERKKILIITHHNIYPVESGGAITMVAYIDELQKHHDVSIILFNPYVPENEDLAELQERWSKVNIYTSEIKRPTFFQKTKKDIKSILQSWGYMKPPVYSLEDTSFMSYEPLKSDSIALLEKVLRNEKFDLIEVNHSDQLPIVFCLPKDIPCIFVNHEPRFKRTLIQIQNRLIDPFYGDAHYKYQLFTENNLMNNYDAVICLNDNDTELIQENISRPVFTATFPVLEEDIADIQPNDSPIKRVFFLGSGNHYPNFDAVKWYKNELGKEIYNKTGFKLEVFGHWDGGKRAILECDYIIFKGFVKDLNDIVDDAVMLVPIRYGGGIRTKIQWAMGKGVPVISTTFGHEGIPAMHKKSIMIAENGPQYLLALQEILNNSELRNTIRKNANTIVRQNFSPLAMVNKRMAIYEQVIAAKTETA